jgi:hypothetical protein
VVPQSQQPAGTPSRGVNFPTQCVAVDLFLTVRVDEGQKRLDRISSSITNEKKSVKIRANPWPGSAALD